MSLLQRQRAGGARGSIPLGYDWDTELWKALEKLPVKDDYDSRVLATATDLWLVSDGIYHRDDGGQWTRRPSPQTTAFAAPDGTLYSGSNSNGGTPDQW